MLTAAAIIAAKGQRESGEAVREFEAVSPVCYDYTPGGGVAQLVRAAES